MRLPAGWSDTGKLDQFRKCCEIALALTIRRWRGLVVTMPILGGNPEKVQYFDGSGFRSRSNTMGSWQLINAAQVSYHMDRSAITLTHLKPLLQCTARRRS